VVLFQNGSETIGVQLLLLHFGVVTFIRPVVLQQCLGLPLDILLGWVCTVFLVYLVDRDLLLFMILGLGLRCIHHEMESFFRRLQ